MGVKDTNTGDPKLDALIEDVADAVFLCGEWDSDEEGPYDACVEKARKARLALSTYLRERLPPTVGDEHGKA